jgi:predicted transcriptional regulator
MTERRSLLILEHGLRLRDLLLLYVICAEGSIEVDELSCTLKLDRSTMLHSIDRLQECGLILQQSRSNKSAAVVISATSTGADFVNKYDTEK